MFFLLCQKCFIKIQFLRESEKKTDIKRLIAQLQKNKRKCFNKKKKHNLNAAFNIQKKKEEINKKTKFSFFKLWSFGFKNVNEEKKTTTTLFFLIFICLFVCLPIAMLFCLPWRTVKLNVRNVSVYCSER